MLRLLALLLLVGPVALAAPPDDWHERVQYFRDTDQRDEAIATLVAVLSDDPTELRAHHLYIALKSEAGEAEFIERQYRAYAEGSTDPVRRAALAAAIAHRASASGSSCREAMKLLQPAVQDPEQALAYLLVKGGVQRSCGMPEPDELDLVPAAERSPHGAPTLLRMRIRVDGESARLPTALAREFRRRPRLLRFATELWEVADPPPKAIARARAESLEAARERVVDDDHLVVAAAWAVLAGRDPEAAGAAAERLAELDPNARLGRGLRSRLRTRIQEASRRADPAVALKALEELEAQLPPSGSERAAWHSARGGLLDRLDRGDDAHQQALAAWRADPEDPLLANAFAYRAANRGQNLQEALEAASRAVSAAEASGFVGHERSSPGHPWEHWREHQADLLGRLLDTRGWVLHALGRHDEAATALRRAVLLSPDAVLQLHLGLVYDALGDAGRARTHLLIGLSAGPPEEPELAERARARLEGLVAAGTDWHPDGVDGLLADREPGAVPLAPRPKPSEPHDPVGQTFPNLSLRIDGESVTLASLGGPLVLDVWATWCDPCVAAMQPLDELARRYEGRVRVVAVSVDESPADADRFWTGADVAIVPAWAGPRPLSRAGVVQIPATLVLDADRTVVAVVAGYAGAGADRIDEALRTLVGD